MRNEKSLKKTFFKLFLFINVVSCANFIAQDDVWACLTKPYAELLRCRIKNVGQQIEESAEKCAQDSPLLSELIGLIEESKDQRIAAVRQQHLDGLSLLGVFHSYCNRSLLALETDAQIMVQTIDRRVIARFENNLLTIQELNISKSLRAFISSAIQRNQSKAIEEAITLFKSLRELKDRNILSTSVIEASAVYVVEVFESEDIQLSSTSLLRSLWKEEVSLRDADFMKILYANRVLRNGALRSSKKCAQQTVELLEPLAEKERFRFTKFHNLLGISYVDLGQYDKAIQLLSDARELFDDRHPITTEVLAKLYLVQNNWGVSADLWLELFNKEQEVLKKEGNFRANRKLLILALQNANQPDKAIPYLLDIQTESLSRRSLQLARIKAELDQNRANSEALRLLPSPIAFRNETDSKAEAPRNEELYSSPTDSNFKKPKFNISQKKEKIKTRGIGFQTPAVESNLAIQMPRYRKLETVEELLGEHKNALNIFYKLFESYETQHVRVAAIDISMNEIEMLMDALQQDFNPTKGKGSHTKVTLRQESLQPSLSNTIDETMIILSQATKLSGAQIAQLRDSFIDYYLFPAHLKEILVKKGKLAF